MQTDWKSLAKQLGALHADGSESGGDSFAQTAFDEILGDEWIESTVEYIIALKRGSTLALSCLSYLQSTRAVRYAYHVYKTSDGERADMAVLLISDLSNPISYQWIEEFLNDENVIHRGLSVLDKLLWAEVIPYDSKAESLLRLAEVNSEGGLNSQIEFIREYLKDRS